ncbi:SipW-dependent-type signal peptide-containing protein, partial [Halomonas sp.]
MRHRGVTLAAWTDTETAQGTFAAS